MLRSKLLNLVAALLTILVFREILRFMASDFVLSIIPSWNSTIYPEHEVLNLRTLLFGIAALIMVGIYKLTRGLLTKAFEKREDQ